MYEQFVRGMRLLHAEVTVLQLAAWLGWSIWCVMMVILTMAVLP